MSRLIDADALHREFIDFIRASNNKTPNWNDAVSLVGSAPTVDAVEVVRCEDCKHRAGHMDGYTKCDRTERIRIWHPDDWYCAYGKRKKE